MYPIVRSGTLHGPLQRESYRLCKACLLLADNAQHFYSLDYDVVL
jgi:hypothetical protein